ncbi:MAG: F0F1 ATP synthase subunit delta [Treponema sp.]|jgi:F-type H+-transporting ATPase subunit delta|nr:F0F1 ATP synthase subunit delta [Treponema sp.]
MFVPQHWARGFINAAGNAKGDAAAALDLVKALAPVILSVPGQVSGTGAALRLEPLIRKALPGPADPAAELALGLILLLVRKQSFKHVEKVIDAVERELDARRGVLRVRLESARPPEDEFLEKLKLGLMKRTGAAGIKLDIAVTPELLAGYCLRIGSQTIEVSLRLHLRQLGAEIAETHAEACNENSTKNSTAHGGF